MQHFNKERHGKRKREIYSEIYKEKNIKRFTKASRPIIIE